MSSCPSVRLPRVLMPQNLDPAQKFGTLEEQVLKLARAFHDEGGLLLPLYASPLGPEAEADYRSAGLRAEWLDLRRFTPANLARLVRLVLRERIELVHWNFYEPVTNPYTWGLSVVAPWVGHLFTDHISRPAVPSAPPSPAKRAVKRALLKRYRASLCVSEFVLEQCRAQGIWPDLRKVTHFVNVRRFAPDPAARERVRDRLDARDRFVGLVISHLVPGKGVEVTVRATAKLPERAVLWVVGQGPEAERLQALAEQLGVAGRVRFLGIQRYVEPFLQAADVFFCPSLWEEAAGLVNIEALSSGLPVVASRVGGIPEIVEEGVTGFLVPPGDPEALAERVRPLMEDPDLRRRFGENARAAALAQYSAEALVPQYLELYRELAGRPTREASLAGR